MPKRIQLHRTKGWRKPEGAVVVSRPSKWGNPFPVGGPAPGGGTVRDRAHSVELYRRHVPAWVAEQAPRELAGRDLACWCPLDGPCHADVLLQLANLGTGPGAAEAGAPAPRP